MNTRLRVRSESSIGIETRQELRNMGLLGGDLSDVPTSEKRFARGGQYGIELPSMNSPEIIKFTLEMLEKYQVACDQFVECRGIFRLTDSELTEMVSIARDRSIGLVLSVGPRATYDTGGFVKSPNGVRIGYRLRGMEQLVRAVEDVKRGLSFGVRGFLVYDEGLLWILNEMRKSGAIPGETVLKFSVHCGYANPVAIRVVGQMGADIVNPVPDLDLSMVAAIRETTSCVLSIFTDTASEAGGFVRTYDAPEFVRVASPVFLKCGSSSQQHQGHLPSREELTIRVKQAKQVVSTIARYLPSAKRIDLGEAIKAIPVA